ncbi:LOW QUALITY PROTEIN: hypothetical protein PHMEG_00014133 [Phytophthora megakarya]|uniref:Uncharacterized protein n=1 Tax=Phytophthora megakarya TaxID=4795 RepID=A0A225W5M6_9STRA|nr:LOW QUALITY PROTEIN: hypothetical protein PHMEG_00014133 [Phytophthora megakarya]
MVTLEKYKSEVERMREGLAEKFESTSYPWICYDDEAMEMAFEAVLARSNACCRKQHSSEQSCCPQPVTQVDAPAAPYSSLHTWNGAFRRVPKGLLSALCGGYGTGQPPLRLLTKVDMTTRGIKVRLAELQRLMRHVESLLSDDEVSRAYSSTDSTGVLFTQVNARLAFPSSSSKGRRLDQLSWRTLARELKR